MLQRQNTLELEFQTTDKTCLCHGWIIHHIADHRIHCHREVAASHHLGVDLEGHQRHVSLKTGIKIERVERLPAVHGLLPLLLTLLQPLHRWGTTELFALLLQCRCFVLKLVKCGQNQLIRQRYCGGIFDTGCRSIQ